MLKLNIGCGEVHMDGWLNIDSESEKADLMHDLRKPLPYNDNFVDFIYSEHFIEHLTPEEGESVFKETYRVLKNNGVMRIATPDLDYIVFRYLSGWKKQAWIEEYGYSYIQTKAEMINIMFNHWGHKWLYNFEELRRRLKSASFTNIKRVKLGTSDYGVLQNLETREDSKLIVEAVK